MQKYLRENGLYPINILDLSKATIPQKLVIVCLAYAMIIAAIWPSEFIILLESYVRKQLVMMPQLLFVGLPLFGVILAPRAPLSYIKRLIYKRGLGVLIIALMFALSMAGFSTAKHAISYVVGFYAEFPIADLDELLHGGQPWRPLHNWTPEWMYFVLQTSYGILWGVEWVGCILIGMFLLNHRQRTRFFLAYILTFIVLGTVLRTVGASGGPIFYDRLYGGERFADMMVSLHNIGNAEGIMAIADYLYDAYLRDDAVLGAGISAMPSMHVALTVLNALFLSQFNRWVGLSAWLFVFTILYGSVFFGWHYALDGYVSIVLVILIWKIAGRITADIPDSYALNKT